MTRDSFLSRLFVAVFWLAPVLCAHAITAPSPSGRDGDLIESAALEGKRVLLVGGDKPSDDQMVAAYLHTLGMKVTLERSAGDAAPRDTDLVMISSTADAVRQASRFRDSTIPIVSWSGPGYAELGMTGDVAERDFGLQGDDRYSYGSSPTHPIARSAGLPAEIFNTQFFDHHPMTWGRPGPSAETVTIIRGDPNKAGIFTYEKSARLADGSTAPARRAGFYLSDRNFHQLSYGAGPAETEHSQRSWFVGRKLFEATIRWALTPPPAPPDYRTIREDLQNAAKGKKLLYVRRSAVPPAASANADQVNIAYLSDLGFEVDVVDQMVSDEAARGKDLVVIAASVGANRFGARYQGVDVPVIVSEAIILPYMRMTGLIRRVDFFWSGEGRGDDGLQDIDIVNPSHIVAGGSQGGLTRIYDSPGSIKWGRPLPGAEVIAVVPNHPDKAAAFGYRKGATMNLGFRAPARRIFFFLDNGMFEQLSNAGKQMYDATLLWALQPEQN